MSSLFLRTLRDNPADAEVPSHQLLVRAGYVRRVAPGVYSWLPLGLKVLRNIERVVREEMDAIGGQEILFPALLPRAPYETTNRWTEYGDSVFRLQDRRGNDYLLGPTHEELFTLLVKGEYSSYKDLPVILYQVQTKYRDEARPRAGLFRGREFTMKDSYSFDVDDAGLDKSYALHRDAYIRIFDRLGLDYVDIFYSHRFDPDTPLEETMGALDAIVRSGRALYVGISNYDSGQTERAAAILRDLGTPLLINQPSYSMLNRWIEQPNERAGGKNLLGALTEAGMGSICFTPLAQGMLTSRYLDGVPEGSRATQGKSLGENLLSDEALGHIRALNDIAAGRGQTLAQMALSWVLRDRRITTALFGASSVQQVEDNVAAAAKV